MRGKSLLPLIGLCILAWTLIIILLRGPEHQRCNQAQLESIGRAGGTLRPGTCDNLSH